MAVVLHPIGFRWRFAEIARGELRTREVGNNGGPAVRRYQASTWLAPASWPWCAAFVCWCYEQTAKELCPYLLPTRPRTPRAYEFEQWGKNYGRNTIHGRETRQGDIVIFRFSHVGIAVQPYSAVLGVVTVDGNTSAQSINNEGDGVWMRTRSLSNVRSIVKIYESSTPQSA